ncbi:TetR/AcrR family transcriptional regulator [Dickeya dadantii]|uniref:TetR/AcrR family transcriptional regulator n=1 Tax=Dickeya dadantii TaxID=204038 RepID=UPI00149577F6|nr:TetR/AcrR family transcriptional regulator [Dickeya dadantii]NPE56774.1 TetR/AcrR family transcriptional regulator [Dickeya dadantii]NPE67485.1 TetR/AcrR family transcriptional regulator [Dickeya dadantii]
MARPLSEEKRESILTAAAELVATLGTGASTAKIAKAAGVAEGTLFTYFATKDELLNQLLLEIETDLARSVLDSCAAGGSPRECVQRIWNCLVDWGIAHPEQRKAMRQLKVSDRISDECRQSCNNLFREARESVERCLTGYVDPERASFYIDTALLGLANISIDAITVNPQGHEHIRQAGFDLFWKGIAA